MLTTLLDGLTLLGQATLHTVWVPVLAWTILALPIWWGLERADGVHPFVTYRLHQTLLAALPLGLLVAALGLPWTGGTGPLLELPTLVVGRPSLSVEALDAGRSGAASVSWHWMQGIGLATAAAGLFAALALGRLAFDALAALQARTTSERFPPSARSRASSILRATGLRRPVQVRIHPGAAVPVAIGGIRPTVLIPPALLQSPESLRMALAHEGVHLRRYDDLAQLLERLVVAVFSAHPLVHRLSAAIGRAREQACDAAVLSDDAVSSVAYARLLNTFASGASAPTGALSLSESSSLIDRLRAMRSLSSLSSWPPALLTVGALAVGLSLVFGVAACSDSLTNPSAEETASSSSSAQTQSSGDGPYVVVEDQPELIGGMSALQEAMSYPEMAREAGLEGRVIVQFVVGTDGTVQNPTVTRGVHKLLNEEALRAVQQLNFEPGRQRGEPVRVRMSLPVTFQLPDSAASESNTTISPEGSSAGDTALEDRVQNAFRSVEYPDLLRKGGVEGRAVVTFTIGPSGQIQDPRVAESAHEALDTAALQAVQNLNIDGTGQSTDVTLPITFSHSEEDGAEIRFEVNAS